MSDTHDPTEDERTDPSVALPADAPTDQLQIRQSKLGGVGGEAQPMARAPSSLPPRSPMTPPRSPMTPPPLPMMPPRTPTQRPPAQQSAPQQSAPQHAAPQHAASQRPITQRPPATTTSRLPPALGSARPLERRPGSVPPGGMPRPSDPPPARTEPTALQRQRLAQMETQLDQARSTIARQKNELDELRSRVEAGDARLGELLATLQDDGRSDAIERRLDTIEARREQLATEVSRRLDEAAEVELAPRIDKLDERLRVLEEGTGESRIRMRLERAGHRIEELERRLASIEETQRTTGESVRRSAQLEEAREDRLARIESLFEELADEVHRDRESHDLDGLRARLDDVEALVLKTGTNEAALERKVGEQERALERLRESLPPPGAPPVTGDDLTRIKGVGPKYARLLAEMGVTAFAQIAAWTDDDLDHMAEQLGMPVARIKKARWVENAAKLAAG